MARRKFPLHCRAESSPPDDVARAGSAEPGSNRTACIEFQVEDIDAEYARLKDKVELVHELKTMPWGNKTFQFRDPEGTAVSLYMPATDEARKRFASR